VEDQLVEVGRRWPIFQLRRPFSRCCECNEELETADAAWAKQRVPPYVARTQQLFKHCPQCGRIYWGATHTDQMAGFFRRLAERIAEIYPESKNGRGAGPPR
jgi:uncharacterized protein with PIN domain